MAFTMPSFISRLTRPFTASTRLGITAPASVPEGAQRCTVAAGCFWGTEHIYRKHFADKGLIDVRVGYIGGKSDNPSYRAVCSGATGREYLQQPFSPTIANLTVTDAEAAQVIFDPTKVSYRQLLELFYRMHDPTTLNRQGPDTGSQYRSAIFFHDEEQGKVAKEVTALVNEKWWKGKVVTEVVEAGRWYDAEEYHQLYLDRNPGGYECPSHFLRSFPPLE
jgi:peptide-methionine (S)-S-oxide reductase